MCGSVWTDYCQCSKLPFLTYRRHRIWEWEKIRIGWNCALLRGDMGQLNICKFPHRKIAAHCKKTCPKLGIFDPPMKYWNVTSQNRPRLLCLWLIIQSLERIRKVENKLGGEGLKRANPQTQSKASEIVITIWPTPRASPQKKKNGILWNNFIKRRLTHGHWKVEQYSAEAESAKAFSHDFSVYLSEKISCSKRCKFFNQMSQRG